MGLWTDSFFIQLQQNIFGQQAVLLLLQP